MIDTGPAPLSQGTCRTRLASSRRGFLACSQSAMPNVVPVELRAVDGQLLVSVPASVVRERLVGQVVALSIGKHAFRFCKGWSVTAHGRLGEPVRGGALPLEIAQLEGATYSRALPNSAP